jgi:hypothetical protein
MSGIAWSPSVSVCICVPVHEFLFYFPAYAAAIEQSVDQYVQEAKASMAKGNKDKAQIAMSKKKLVEREVRSKALFYNECD